MAGGVPRRGGRESLLSHGFAVPALPEGKPRALRAVPAPRIYEGGGPRSGRGSPPRRRGKPPQSRLRRASSPRGEAEGAAPQSPVIPSRFSNRRGNPPDERYGGTTSLAPRIYEGGGPRSGRGSLSAAAAGKASSVTASPCQLPQRGSRGRFAPFLPPRIYEGGGPRSGGGSLSAAAGTALSVTAAPCQLSQGESQGSCAPRIGHSEPVLLIGMRIPPVERHSGTKAHIETLPGKTSCTGKLR